jgi:hypothetical protein
LRISPATGVEFILRQGMQWVSAFRYSGRADGMTSTRCISVCDRPGKNFLTLLQHWSGAVTSGLLMRQVLPLALILCADRVPVNSTHSTMRWHKWVVLIAGSTGSALRAARPPNLHITPVIRRDLA